MNRISAAFKFYLRVLTVVTMLFVTPVDTMAQKVRTVEAVLADEGDSSAIESATITVFKYGDSAKLLQTLSNKKGLFTLRAIPDSVVVFVQHGSYGSFRKTLFPKQTLPDTIWLTPSIKELQTVTIKTATPAIVIRKDTTEFNIDSFEVRDNDVVADLLRRLPGLEIDETGQIRFEGKPINKILIDGEEFFSGNPEFSLHKLPANFVSKIQVMDSKSLEQLFTGMGAGGEEKTLNIKLKPGTKTFATASAMAGTRNQLSADGSFSVIRDKQTVSVMASGNSSNHIGVASKANGPVAAGKSLGLNLSQRLGKSSLRGSSSYTDNSNTYDSYRELQRYISADSSFFRKTGSHSDSRTYSNRANLSATIWIDTVTQLSVDLSFSQMQNSNESNTTIQTLEQGILKNNGIRSYRSFFSNRNIGGSIMLGRRFNAKGRSLSFTYQTSSSQQTNDGFNSSQDSFYKTGIVDSTLILDQHLNAVGETNNHSIRLAYTEPLSQTLRLQLGANAAWSGSRSVRTTYNRDSLHQLEEEDTAFSNTIRSANLQQGATLSVMYNTKSLFLTTGLSVTTNNSQRDIKGRGRIEQQQLQYAPSVNVNYTLSKTRSLRFGYSAVSNQPSIDQLQPIPDNSNTLYVRLGNPALKPSFSQNYSLSYSAYRGRKNFSANAAYAPITNSIVNASYFNDLLQQVSQAINVSGIYTASGSASFSSQRKRGLRIDQWNAGTGGNYGRNVFFQKGSQYPSRNYSIRSNLGFSRRTSQMEYASGFSINASASYNRSLTPQNAAGVNSSNLLLTPGADVSFSLFKIVHLNTAYRYSYNKVAYNTNGSTRYRQHVLNQRVYMLFSQWCRLESDLVYQYDNRGAFGVAPESITWNASLSANLLKHHAAFIKLSALDLLNNKRNVRRTIGENFVEDVQTNELHNYFTLQIQYNFSRIAKKEKATTPPKY